MNGQHIPGFYYDQEKKKYFKIQSQSASRGLDLKYSTSNLIKEKRKALIQEAVTARTSKLRKQRVIRRHADSFVQTNLEREIGFRRRSFYLLNTWPEACMSGVTAIPQAVVSNDTDGIVRFFDRDPITKTIYAVCGENRVKRRQHLGDDQAVNLHCQRSRDKLRALDTKSRYSYYPWDEISRTTSTVSSFQYMPTSGALAVTTIGSDRPPIVQLSDPERDGPHISQVFTPKSCATIWTSAARPASFSSSLPQSQSNTVPASEAEHLAVSAQQSLLLFTRSTSGSWESRIAVPSLHADILALEWLNHNTIALGCRNGKIHLYDARSGGNSHILTHPYPISKLKRADDATRIVCSGLQNTLFLYDIRNPRLSPAANKERFNTKDHHYSEAYFKTLYPGNRDHKKRRKLNHTAFMKWSQPVLSYPHTNLDDMDLDIAVNSRLGLVAAAQDGANCEKAIRVSNLWTGKTIREFDWPGKKAKGHQKIRNLKWMDDDDGNVSLWAAWGGSVASFSW